MHSSAIGLALADGQEHVHLPAGQRGRNGVGQGDEVVRLLAHGRHHDHEVVPWRLVNADVLGHGLDPVGVGHGGAAVLLDDQGHGCHTVARPTRPITSLPRPSRPLMTSGDEGRLPGRSSRSIACRLRGHRQEGTTEGEPPGSLAELERQQRRSSARKKYIRIGVIVVIALAAAFGLSRLIGRDSSVSTTDTTVPSDGSATTVPPSHRPRHGHHRSDTVPAGRRRRHAGLGLRGPAAHLHRPEQDLHRARRDHGRQLHHRARPEVRAPHREQLRRAVPLPLLRRDPVPPHRAGLRRPGWRSDAAPAAADLATPSPTSCRPSKESYKAGTVAMANSGPDTNGSQFFVVLDPSGLDGPQVLDLRPGHGRLRHHGQGVGGGRAGRPDPDRQQGDHHRVVTPRRRRRRER